MNRAKEWWKHEAIYQIYPRSFQDTNGDGVGDLRGVTRRLDYLRWLGVGGIWLSPIFTSPMVDFGYDVADYCTIDPVFGTLDDFDRLVAEAHRRDLKIILDFVPNHTSDRHRWFIESRSDRKSPFRDRYIWKDAEPDGSPPNNWLCISTGESAWVWDEGTEQYFLATFTPNQPDLNWRNEATRRAMHDVLRFWLERGVDGFRVDMIGFLLKDERWRDEPRRTAPSTHRRLDEAVHFPWDDMEHIYTTNRPGLHELLAEIRETTDAFDGAVLIGEFEYSTPLSVLAGHYGTEAHPIVHLPFNFNLIGMPWHASAVRAFVERYEEALPAFAQPNYVLGNHDKPRIASHTGAGQARVAMMLLLTLRGTPFLYYGDEIGMTNVPIPAERAQDPWARTLPALSRDPVRTPMQWDASPAGGFSDAMSEPWLPVGDTAACNVEHQRVDEGSLLRLTRELLGARRDHEVLTAGVYRTIPSDCEHCFVYEREYDRQRIVVALNFGNTPVDLSIPGAGIVMISTHMDRRDEPCGPGMHLRADEGCVVLIDSPARRGA